MNQTRRMFLKLTGFSLFGLGTWPMASTFAGTGLPKFVQNDEALSGNRWAVVIDPKKCKEGCSDCINVCHGIHNVPHFENPKDEIKWIWKERFEKAFSEQTNDYSEEYIKATLKGNRFPILCNHCDNPPCVRVCPTQATWRRQDGIVMMDYHRCIGCRYCMAACPYGARSFNWRDPRAFMKEINKEFPTRTKGVVEKCDFCAERLAKGLIPACVEACKEKALLFGDVKDPHSGLRELLRTRHSIRRNPQLGTNPQVYYLV